MHAAIHCGPLKISTVTELSINSMGATADCQGFSELSNSSPDLTCRNSMKSQSMLRYQCYNNIQVVPWDYNTPRGFNIFSFTTLAATAPPFSNAMAPIIAKRDSAATVSTPEPFR